MAEAGRMEKAYVDNPSDTKQAWLAAQSMLRPVELQLAENKHFFIQ